MNPYQTNCINGAWMPTVVFDSSTNIDRDVSIIHFHSKGIDVRTFFWPLSQLPAFSETDLNPVAYSISDRAINLPSYVDMKSEELELVLDTVISLL